MSMNRQVQLLIVDDDEDIRGLLRELLTRAGFAVDEAPDGRTALRRLYEAPPALVLLDVSMPGMDGYQTLERIRDLSDVPVIMLTARAEEAEKFAVSPAAPTTTSRSRSGARSCSRASRRSSAARAARSK